MVARCQWTRQWWDELRYDYTLATSVAVLDELGAGEYPGKDDAISLLKDVPLVSIDATVADIVRAYIQHKVMPKDPVGDALEREPTVYELPSPEVTG